MRHRILKRAASFFLAFVLFTAVFANNSYIKAVELEEDFSSEAVDQYEEDTEDAVFDELQEESADVTGDPEEETGDDVSVSAEESSGEPSGPAEESSGEPSEPAEEFSGEPSEPVEESSGEPSEPAGESNEESSQAAQVRPANSPLIPQPETFALALRITGVEAKEIFRGVAFDPYEGVRVLNEADENITDDATLVADVEGFDSRTPGEYTIKYSAVHPDDPNVTVQVDRVITVKPYSSQGEASLASTSAFEIGQQVFLKLTYNLDKNRDTGRYIQLTAPEGFGFAFSENNGSHAGVESVELSGDKQSLVLKIIDSAPQDVLVIDFPVTHTINAAVSEKLRANMKFTFTAKWYSLLSEAPAASDQEDGSDTVSFTLPDHPVDSVRADINPTNYQPAIDQYGDSVPAVGVRLRKSAGSMRSTYKMQLLVPVHPALVPADTASTITKGGITYFIADIATERVQANVLLNPPVSTVDLIGSLTPTFKNLSELAPGVYESSEFMQLRLWQYGSYTDVNLRHGYGGTTFKYKLTKTETAREAKLTYNISPSWDYQGLTGAALNFTPSKSRYEWAYTDLNINVDLVAEVQPKSITINSADYGQARIGYTLSGGGVVEPGEDFLDGLTFEIPEGEYVISVQIIPKPFPEAANSVHFTLYSDYLSAYADDPATELPETYPAPVKYALSSEEYPQLNRDKKTFNFSLIRPTYLYPFVYANTTFTLSEGGTYTLETDTSKRHTSASVLKLRYASSTKHKEFTDRSLEWQFDAATAKTHPEFLKSVVGITANASYVGSYAYTYTTNLTPGGTTTTVSDGNFSAFTLGATEYVTGLKVEFSLKENNAVHSSRDLFEINMNLNKYNTLYPGQDLPAITETNHTLPVSTTVSYAGGGARTVSGVAGTLKRPVAAAATDVYLSSALGKLVTTGTPNVYQGGTFEVTVKDLMSAHVITTAEYRTTMASRTLENITSYIPISSGFTATGRVTLSVAGSMGIMIQDNTVIGDVKFIPGTGGQNGWLVIHWDKLATSKYGSNDQTGTNMMLMASLQVTFEVKAAPTLDNYVTPYDVVNGYIYSDVSNAIGVSGDGKLNYQFCTSDNNGGTYDLGNGSQEYPSLTRCQVKLQARILQSSAFGVDLYGGLDGGYVDDNSVTYYNHQNPTGLLKMNVFVGQSGTGTDDAVAYISVPSNGSGAHKGIGLTQPAANILSGLPAGSSIAYTKSANPTQAMLQGAWSEQAESGYETGAGFTPADWASVTMIRVIGKNLNKDPKYVTLSFANKEAKQKTDNQTLSLNVVYRTKGGAEGTNSVSFTLTDYTVNGEFWLDQNKTGQMLSSSQRLSGYISAKSQTTGRVYAATVGSNNGYSMKIPAYGNYEFTVAAPGYEPTQHGANPPFDPSGVAVKAISRLETTLSAGFVQSEKVTVVFVSNGGDEIPAVTRIAGETVPKPMDMEREGFVFGGWYEGNQDGSFSATTAKWSFTSDRIPDKYIGKTLYLCAKWTESVLELESVPYLNYGVHDLPVRPTTVSILSPWLLSLTLTNTKAEKWQISLKCTQPLSIKEGPNRGGDELKDALVFDDGGSAIPLTESIIVYNGDQTGEGINVPWNSMAPLNNVKVKVEPGQPKVGEYQATLCWSVEMVP